MSRWARTGALARSAAGALALIVAGGGGAAAGEVAPARQAELADLVLQDCGSCHGMTMKGGLGAALRPGDLSDLDADTLAATILDGVPGTPMPPWRGLISEVEAAWIADALKAGDIQ